MKDFLTDLIKSALAEDIGPGDVTSALLIPESLELNMAVAARQPMVLAGSDAIRLVFAELDPRVNVELRATDGEKLLGGKFIATISGPARSILTGERTMLNILQHMSGIATTTRKFVDSVAGTKVKILDTRKTTPGMRLADKYAVRMGGGENHRMGLYDAVLVKDNHLAGRGQGLAALIAEIRQKLTSPLPVIVECDTIAQLAEAVEAGPDRIMLDNMTPADLREAVRLTAGRVKLEATGGVNLSNIREVATTGVDYISIGAITHSAPSVDIGLDAL